MNTTDALLMAAFGGKKTVIIPRKAINLLDIKGNVFRAYDKAQFLALTELPAPPSADGFTPKGWNWTLPEAKAAVEANGKLDVAPEYETSDGKTHIYITLYEGRLSPKLEFKLKGTATVDWGDGSDPDTQTKASLTAVAFSHTYVTPGEKVISIELTDGSYFTLSQGSFPDNTSARLFDNPVYRNAVKRIDFGNGLTGIDAAGLSGFYGLEEINLPTSGLSALVSFQYAGSLKSLIVPENITSLGSTALGRGYSLKNIVLPNTLTTIEQNAFVYCYALESITIPQGVTRIRQETFNECYSLKKVDFLGNITSIDTKAFYDCYSLTSVTIPATVTSIGKNAFAFCYSLAKVRFLPTIPPEMTSSAFGSRTPTDCIFYVPYAGLAAYLSAANYPSPSTYTYLGYATYTSGAALPAQDGTEAYNVTWYATRADAKAGTNPITEGNGNEIYCTYAAVTA